MALNNISTHNISTLAGQVYDLLAGNTDNEQFDRNDPDLEDMYVDETMGIITIKYADKTFELVVRETW